MFEAHEKGESEHDTLHSIDFNDEHFKIKKQSRVTDLGYVVFNVGFFASCFVLAFLHFFF